MSIRAWLGLQWPKFPTHEEVRYRNCAGVRRQTCERHAVYDFCARYCTRFPQDEGEADCFQFIGDGN
jgi:hypothetical protein